jgi:uncharacterized membrane protein YhaH (DUF805 family)
MNEASITLLGTILYCLVLGIPAAQILHRTGYSRWLALLLLVPVVGVVMFWIFAFGEWPVDKTTNEREHNRERDNWSDADKEAFRAAMNKPRS